MDSSVNIEEAKKEILKLLDALHVNYLMSRAEHNKGELISIKMVNAILEITLGSAWVGYDLSVNTFNAGKPIGVSEDTDNYELGGDNASHTIELIEYIKELVKALACHEILVGSIESNAAIAIPIDKETYNVTTAGKFGSYKSYAASSEAIRKHKELKPLK